MKLTPSQRRYLEAAPFTLVKWGGEIQAGRPFKGFNENRAWDLTRAGLLKTSMPEAFRTTYTRTEKGDAAIAPSRPA